MPVFKVEGMRCAHCEQAVTRAIQGQDPDAVVRVDLAAGTVQVESMLPEQSLQALIREEGFEVR